MPIFANRRESISNIECEDIKVTAINKEICLSDPIEWRKDEECCEVDRGFDGQLSGISSIHQRSEKHG
jgi:hypothetical protein